MHCQMMRAHDGAKATGDICSIVMLAHGTRPWSYTFFRLIETVQSDEIGLASNGADVLSGPKGKAVKRIQGLREKHERQIFDQLLCVKTVRPAYRAASTKS
jgi:hypothetical protein